MKIEIFEDANGEFRWRGIERNGRIIVSSAEGYVTLSGARAAVNNVVTEFRGDIEVRGRPQMLTRGRQHEPLVGYDVIEEYPAANIVEVTSTETLRDA